MNILVSKRSWLLAPATFLVAAALLAVTWAVMEPQNLRAAFDADGRSFFAGLLYDLIQKFSLAGHV